MDRHAEVIEQCEFEREKPNDGSSQEVGTFRRILPQVKTLNDVSGKIILSHYPLVHSF